MIDIIEFREVKKSFGNNLVLDEISFKIPTGVVFGLVGRSGAGKSTLLRAINGLEIINGGEVIVDNLNIQNLKDEELRNLRKEIGMIFQNYSLVTRASVYENIAMPLRCWGWKEDEIEKRVEDLLELVGLSEKKKEKSRNLSGGQKQRVAIARALALSPKVLLCDEATSALDPKSTEGIIEILLDVNKKLGITVVIVTHEMDVIRKTCDQIAILENGKMAEIGTVEAIFEAQSEALLNLIGRDKKLYAKPGESLVRFGYPKTVENKSILADLLDIEKEIEFHEIREQNLKDSVIVNVISTVQNDSEKKVEAYLKKNNLSYQLERGEING